MKSTWADGVDTTRGPVDQDGLACREPSVVDPVNPADVAAVNALQDRLELSGAVGTSFEMPD
jgi:hypothetical protein